jgi:L-alanine-DL-glutamate epimerase-like enolase superfamily enzyme
VKQAAKMRVEAEPWPLRAPFRISGHVFDRVDVVHVTLESDGQSGHGESAGVYYKNESARSMTRDLKKVRAKLEANLSHDSVRQLLPTGGARSAVDCALWELEARLQGMPVWKLMGLEQPHPLLTNFGCDAQPPEDMAATALSYTQAKAIKLKLTGDRQDADRVRAVREARPDVKLSVDANQGFNRTSLEALLPALVAARVALIEQPFPVGQDALLDSMEIPIPVAADESVQGLSDIQLAVGRYQVVNIKLDKCGGLGEGVIMARRCRELGLIPMVGSMLGTSLSMAPAYLVGQLCDVVDLDAPLFLATDRSPAVYYSDGQIHCPEAVWG